MRKRRKPKAEHSRVDVDGSAGRARKRWLLGAAASVTLLFVLAYRVATGAWPQPNAILMCYLVTGGAAWAIALLVERARRVRS